MFRQPHVPKQTNGPDVRRFVRILDEDSSTKERKKERIVMVKKERKKE
jgi:hypothetical protein